VKINNNAAFKAGAAPFALALALISAPAFAQDATPQADTATEANDPTAIVVTGSRIARPDLESSVPVSVVGQTQIQQTGAANIQDVLADLPAVGQNISRTSSNFSTTGNGQATVNLRNLGSARTLVLVNGRRFVPGLPGTSIVDLNTIPTDLIKKIEVVTGGASAVYGSEAIAGVVNFVLDDKFEGLRVRGQGNITDKGDSGRRLVSLTAGKSFANGAGHIAINGQYDKDDGLRSKDRDYSARDIPNRSSFAAQGLFSPDGSFAPGAGTFTFGPNNELKNYQGANIDGYNRAADRYLSVPVERYLGTLLANYEFSDKLTVFTELTYAKTKSRSRLEPQAVAYTDLAYADGSAFEGIPIANPFIPQAVKDAMVAGDTAFLPFRRRSNDIFDRSNVNDRTTWRALVGFRGTFGKSLNWDLSYSHGDTKDSTSSGTILAPLYANALNAVAGPNGPVCAINVDADPSNNDPACVPINIFGRNTVSSAAAAYVTNNGQRSTYDARVKQDVVTANLSGSLFSVFGASPVGFALGAEYRREQSSEDFDTATNLGTTLGNQLSDTFGSYNVKEVYGEVSAPLLEDRPFFHYLGVEGAVRYADYSTVGSVWSWKLGGEWAPVRDLRFRAVYSEATRAPNISELFSAQSETFPAVIDPCDQKAGGGDTADITIPRNELPAACLAIPAIAAASSTANGFTYTTAQIQTINGFTGGNRNLKQEVAQTLTLGAVFAPRAIPGFNVTVDYYRIKVKDAIGIIGQQTSLDECLTGSGAALFCNNIIRDPSGRVKTINALNLNTGSYRVEGIDTQVGYRRAFSSSVSIDTTVRWTHLLEQSQTSFPGGPTQNELRQLDCYSCGRLGTGFRDKVNASTTINWNNFSLNWRVNYLSSVVDDNTSDTPIATGAVWYHDAQLRIGIDQAKKFEFYFGIDNIFDRKPPLFGDTNPVTFPGTRTSANTYDLYGRMLYAGFDVRF
jgi:outer membrane receptor protein involved in Fe transport